jgi:hypothetical protein
LAGAPGGSGGRKAGTPGVTFSPGLSYWPRPRMKVSRGFFISVITMTLVMDFSSLTFCFRKSTSCA